MHKVRGSTSFTQSSMEWLRYKKNMHTNHKLQTHSRVCEENNEEENKNDCP